MGGLRSKKLHTGSWPNFPSDSRAGRRHCHTPVWFRKNLADKVTVADDAGLGRSEPYNRSLSTLPINMKPQVLKPALTNAARDATFRISHRAAGTLPASSTFLAPAIG